MHYLFLSLIVVTTLFHLYFWYLESVLWSTPKGQQLFGTTPESAASSKVLAANQGLYNGLLGMGLLTTLFLGQPIEALAIQRFILVFIVVAGIYGAATVTKKIFFLQSLPALLALALS